MDTKICSKCKRELPATSEYFYISKRTKDNLHSVCKKCCYTPRGRIVSIDGTVICTECKKELPATLKYFYIEPRTKVGLQSKCKQCVHDKYYNKEEKVKYVKQWKIDNRERTLELNRRYKKLPKYQSQQRAAEIFRKYKITIEVVRDMMDEQKGICPICGDSLIDPYRELGYAIDHNHTTGEVRGLLCEGCNLGLGSFKDNTSSLREAANYLERYNAK